MSGTQILVSLALCALVVMIVMAVREGRRAPTAKPDRKP